MDMFIEPASEAVCKAVLRAIPDRGILRSELRSRLAAAYGVDEVDAALRRLSRKEPRRDEVVAWDSWRGEVMFRRE